MDPALQQMITTVAGVFIGSLPLVGVIGWAAFTQNNRLNRIEAQLDELGKDLKNLGIRVSNIEIRVSVAETKLDGPRFIAPAQR